MNAMDISARYLPVQSIIIYKSSDAVQWNSREYYLESHDIEFDENGNTFLLEGKPLQKRTLAGLGEILAKQTTDQLQCKGIIPENLVYFNQRPGNTTLIWFAPAKQHQMYFTKGLHLPNGRAYTPSLLFVAHNNRLYIFATKTKKKPTLSTKLYRAPFHNISNDGSVCLGNGKRSEKKYKYFNEVMASWETVFWATEFSAIHGIPVKGNPNTLWKHLIETGELFPNGKLIESQYKTLQELTLNFQ